MIVFIIDDNPDDRALVLHQLNAVLPDAVIREIASSEQLEELFSRERPSLVITDLALGWTSGLDILKRVKALYPECPVIMFTGAGDEEVSVEAMKEGLEDYIVKSPKRLARLRSSIRGVVERAERNSSHLQPRRSARQIAQAQLDASDVYAWMRDELNGALDLLRRVEDHQRAQARADDQLAGAVSRINAVLDALEALDTSQNPRLVRE